MGVHIVIVSTIWELVLKDIGNFVYRHNMFLACFTEGSISKCWKKSGCWVSAVTEPREGPGNLIDSPANTSVRPDDYFYSLKFFLTETEINTSRKAPYNVRTKDNLRCTLLFNRGIPVLLSMIKLTTSSTKFITSVLEVCPPRNFICIVYIMTARIQKDLFFLNSLLTNLTSLQLNLSLVDSDTHD